MSSSADKSYATGERVFSFYPSVGDPRPPLATKVLLLTKGGVCIVGHWSDSDCVAWDYLLRRDKEKEQQWTPTKS